MLRSTSTTSSLSQELRIAVIGAQTAEPESAEPYTVYRTVVTYRGQCFERLLRYRQFLWFYKRFKVRNPNPVPAKFPPKKWTRKSSLEDDVIEARQVMLNEFMKLVARKELTPQSEDCLMKLLRIGKYEDGSGARVSELTSFKESSYIKSERGGTLDAVPEGEEEDSKARRKSAFRLGAAATLASSSIEFPAVTSNSTTIMTDEDRSVIGSQPRMLDDDSGEMIPSELEPTSSSEHPTSRNGHARSAPHKATSIPPSSYSDMVLNRPALKGTQSMPPVRRSKHHGATITAPTPVPAPVSAPLPITPTTTTAEATESESVDGSLSPEKKYRARISTQLSAISRLLSESEAETEDMESSRSIQTHPPVALIA